MVDNHVYRVAGVVRRISPTILMVLPQLTVQRTIRVDEICQEELPNFVDGCVVDEGSSTTIRQVRLSTSGA